MGIAFSFAVIEGEAGSIEEAALVNHPLTPPSKEGEFWSHTMHLRVYCPAKVNLFLSVGPPDRRGYHPVRTIMQAVSLYDVLDLRFGGAAGLSVEGADIGAENTLTKVLRLSQEIFAVPPVHITVTKNIPMQAGLGGGSTDAAGVLRAFNTLKPVSRPEMESVGAAIGVDVPFFLTGGKARGEGYGERITPLPDGLEEWMVILKPTVGCSTPEMYRKLDEKPREWRDWPEADELHNDFERVAPCECLDLIERLQVVGARDAALSGSGSAVFGRFADEEAAQGAAERLGRYGATWTVRTLSRAESMRIERVQ